MDVEPPAPRLDPGTGEPTMRTSGPDPKDPKDSRDAKDVKDVKDAKDAKDAKATASYRAGDTCHPDVADRVGNLASATPSGAWPQSSPVIPALGLCPAPRAPMLTLTPGRPATLPP